MHPTSFAHSNEGPRVENVANEEFARAELKGDRVFFKVFGNFNNRQDYAQIGWSEDGQTWQMAQQKVPMRFDTGKFFMGAKFALFNYATKEVGGLADFDYFRVDAPLHEVR